LHPGEHRTHGCVLARARGKSARGCEGGLRARAAADSPAMYTVAGREKACVRNFGNDGGEAEKKIVGEFGQAASGGSLASRHKEPRAHTTGAP
jgi:hypothetical protein